MDWRTRYADKLVTAEEAVKAVNSGDQVYVGMFNSTPETLALALLARKDELRDVTIQHHVSPFLWATPETAEAFKLVTSFTTPADRQQVHAGLADYLPIGNFRESAVKEVFGQIDVALVKTSPPNENGYMSFGPALWINRTACDVSKQIICEVDERLIRTYGENFIHISEVAHLIEHRASDDREAPIPPRTEEVVMAAEVICTLIATDLINDGDTLQIGIGDVSAAMAVYLEDKHDLGMQTELIPGGVVPLVERGVITGKYKEIAPGKVVGSAFAAVPPEELALVHENPKFELWDFCHTDDLRTLVRETNFVAINNALQIDMTGQITAETLNGQVYSGPGGQTVFAVAASYSEGGRSIIAVPSSSTVDGERHSRIVPVLPPGTMVTVPRTFVDYVVTEYGIATLRGKTVRQRVEELIAVAHPDFRAELRAQAAKLYHV
ncbi:MAG: 4-hydroxybutyrate CoA-transferase [Chloroflexi bacterium]|nr:4-hydroxybutyrate CoA-transferase [Chloroflexota bacterium]